MMFSSSPSRPRTSLRFHPQLDTFEERAVPASFQSYGGDAVAGSTTPPSPDGVNLGTAYPGGASVGPTVGLIVTQVLTPLNTDADADFEQVTFRFRDTTPGTPDLVSLLVYKRLNENSYTNDNDPATPDYDPELFVREQTLLTFKQINTSIDQPDSDGSYTLTVNLPACGYQVDATVGTLLPGPPVGFPNTAHNLDAALGVNACPAPVRGGPADPRTQGYWKNHSEAWGFESLSLGGKVYTKQQLLDIFNTPVRGNGAISLAHQLIAAKLNLAAGARPTQDVMDAINAADAMLGTGNLLDGFRLSTSVTSDLVGQLDRFNNTDL